MDRTNTHAYPITRTGPVLCDKPARCASSSVIARAHWPVADVVAEKMDRAREAKRKVELGKPGQLRVALDVEGADDAVAKDLEV